MEERRRRQKRRKQRVRTSHHRELQLEHFREEFPLEIDEICKLEPLKSHHDAEGFLLALSQIVYLAKRRSDADLVDRILLGAQAARDASERIGLALNGLMSLDIERLRLTFRLAAEFPHPLLRRPHVPKIFKHLNDVSGLLLILSEAMRVSALEPEKARGVGRPSAPYVGPTLELIQLWESICKIPFMKESDLRFIKRVPVPKKLGVQKKPGQRFISKQPSTEFIHLSLQMVDPNIEDSKVFTAIRNALKLRDQFYEFIRQKLPSESPLEMAKKFKQFAGGIRLPKRTRPPTSPLELIEAFRLDEDET